MASTKTQSKKKEAFFKELRKAVETGKVVFGTRNVKKNLLNGLGKIVVVSSNIDVDEKLFLKHLCNIAEIRFIEAGIDAKKLAEYCGKPFVISALLIIDEGEAKI